MKGIILAGGTATRLFPITKTVCKQLLPVYDKPMIYYPMSVLMLAGIQDILVISTPEALPQLKSLFGNGEYLGLKISYAFQDRPRGLADAFIVGADFVGQDRVALVLGDNIFFGHGFSGILRNAAARQEGASVFAYRVRDPERYGVVEFSDDGRVVSIEEKPSQPRSSWAVTGLYFYDNLVVEIAKKIKPSARGEIEITDVNNTYLQQGKLYVERIGRGYAWLDAGTCSSLLDAGIFVKTVEERQGFKIACLEEIAYAMGYISREQLSVLGRAIRTPYGEYLERLAEE